MPTPQKSKLDRTGVDVLEGGAPAFASPPAPSPPSGRRQTPGASALQPQRRNCPFERHFSLLACGGESSHPQIGFVRDGFASSLYTLGIFAAALLSQENQRERCTRQKAMPVR